MTLIFQNCEEKFILNENIKMDRLRDCLCIEQLLFLQDFFQFFAIIVIQKKFYVAKYWNSDRFNLLAESIFIPAFVAVKFGKI